jgi:glutaminase
MKVASSQCMTSNPAPGSTRSSSPIQAYLEQLHQRFAGLSGGRVATYIPALAKADPAAFGIVVATVDGQVYEVGDTRLRFSIQSVSKPLVFGVALEDAGRERVEQAIGVEPSGDAFNSISLEPHTGRPRNPMINAGAIATASLVAGATPAARLARVVDALSAYAGRPLDIDEAVFESERDTGHRNRAIGHMLRNYDIVKDDPEQALTLYFKQCSVLVDCRDLALMAATLANAGINPVSGARAVRADLIGEILSVMTTCGMYDFSGGWAYHVGLPAKSGVGGGIIAVLPGQLGIGVYSPALDERGNSQRGVKVCETISSELGLHFLEPPRNTLATVRARYTLAGVRSKRQRPPTEETLLTRHGASVAVYELQGDLRFATIEPVLREVVASGQALHHVVLDLKRVASADAAATRMLARLADVCAQRGQQLVLTRVRRGDLLADFSNEMNPRHVGAVSFQPQLDGGLEWCERKLIEHYGTPRSGVPALGRLGEHRLCAGMADDDVAHLQSLMQLQAFEAGSLIVQRGQAADQLFLLVRGEVSVVVELPGGGSKRLSTLSAGMCFGESALLAGGTRSADVRADSPVGCWALTAAALATLEAERPRLVVRLLHNLLVAVSETAVRLTTEVAALEG